MSLSRLAWRGASFENAWNIAIWYLIERVYKCLQTAECYEKALASI